MTPTQWITIIGLGLQLWKALNDEKATDSTKTDAIGCFLTAVLPMLKKKNAEAVKEITGESGENIPSILSILNEIGDLFDGEKDA